MQDPIKKRIQDNNKQILEAREIWEAMQQPGFKRIVKWLEETQKEWEEVPVQNIKDNDHLQFLKGGAEYGRGLNAQLPPQFASLSEGKMQFDRKTLSTGNSKQITNWSVSSSKGKLRFFPF